MKTFLGITLFVLSLIGFCSSGLFLLIFLIIALTGNDSLWTLVKVIYGNWRLLFLLYMTTMVFSIIIAHTKKKASFKLSIQSLENLGDEGIPDEIFEGLQPLEYPKITGENKFLDAVEKQIGRDQTIRYKELILKHAEKKDDFSAHVFSAIFLPFIYPLIVSLGLIFTPNIKRLKNKKDIQGLVAPIRSSPFRYSN